MKTEKIKDTGWFYYRECESGISHGLWNNTNLLIGYRYKDQRKGLWIKKYY